LGCQGLGGGDIPFLGTLVAAAKQHDDFFAPAREIDAISRPMVDADFADAVTDGFDVADKAVGDPVQPGGDQRACFAITERARSRLRNVSVCLIRSVIEVVTLILHSPNIKGASICSHLSNL
jgi:hypothetical protein